MVKRANARFRSQGDDASGHWPDLSPYTITDREERGFAPGPPEIRSGELMQYITGSGASVTTTEAVSELKFPGEAPADHEMMMKVAVAQTGAVAHNGAQATPPRPLLAMNGKDVEDILLSLSFSIVDVVRAAF